MGVPPTTGGRLGRSLPRAGTLRTCSIGGKAGGMRFGLGLFPQIRKIPPTASRGTSQRTDPYPQVDRSDSLSAATRRDRGFDRSGFRPCTREPHPDDRRPGHREVSVSRSAAARNVWRRPAAHQGSTGGGPPAPAAAGGPPPDGLRAPCSPRDHSSHGDLSQGRPGHAIDLTDEPTDTGGGGGGLGGLRRLSAASLH
jgi:hypothetical protein